MSRPMRPERLAELRRYAEDTMSGYLAHCARVEGERDSNFLSFQQATARIRALAQTIRDNTQGPNKVGLSLEEYVDRLFAERDAAVALLRERPRYFVNGYHEERVGPYRKWDEKVDALLSATAEGKAEHSPGCMAMRHGSPTRDGYLCNCKPDAASGVKAKPGKCPTCWGDAEFCGCADERAGGESKPCKCGHDWAKHVGEEHCTFCSCERFDTNPQPSEHNNLCSKSAGPVEDCHICTKSPGEVEGRPSDAEIEELAAHPEILQSHTIAYRVRKLLAYVKQTESSNKVFDRAFKSAVERAEAATRSSKEWRHTAERIADERDKAERERDQVAASADMWMERAKEAERARDAAEKRAEILEHDRDLAAEHAAKLGAQLTAATAGEVRTYWEAWALLDEGEETAKLDSLEAAKHWLAGPDLIRGRIVEVTERRRVVTSEESEAK